MNQPTPWWKLGYSNSRKKTNGESGGDRGLRIYSYTFLKIQRKAFIHLWKSAKLCNTPWKFLAQVKNQATRSMEILHEFFWVVIPVLLILITGGVGGAWRYTFLNSPLEFLIFFTLATPGKSGNNKAQPLNIPQICVRSLFGNSKTKNRKPWKFHAHTISLIPLPPWKFHILNLPPAPYLDFFPISPPLAAWKFHFLKLTPPPCPVWLFFGITHSKAKGRKSRPEKFCNSFTNIPGSSMSMPTDWQTPGFCLDFSWNSPSPRNSYPSTAPFKKYLQNLKYNL